MARRHDVATTDGDAPKRYRTLTIYDDPRRRWGAYDMCEKLVDIEEAFQLWRFRHMKTVERIIGHKTGTRGSSGVGFLKRALEQTYFPEPIDVRTAIGTLWARRSWSPGRRGLARQQQRGPRLQYFRSIACAWNARSDSTGAPG